MPIHRKKGDLRNKRRAEEITASGDEKKIQRLRYKNTIFDICGTSYQIQPYLIKAVPWKLIVCKFGLECPEQTSCSHWHDPKELHLPIIIKTSEDSVRHLETLVPGLKFKINGPQWTAHAWAPYTETLNDIVEKHHEYLRDLLIDKAAWKSFACKTTFEHDKEKCAFYHPPEEKPWGT